MFTAPEMLALRDRLRAEGKRLVFTNGVFDLLHPGHLRYLRQARACGDALIVGVNSDRSVRANKGLDRPVTPEAERAEILSALDCVDGVVIFDEDTPHALITAIQPDVLVKGADWGEHAIVGREVVEARGGRVVRVPVEPGADARLRVDEDDAERDAAVLSFEDDSQLLLVAKTDPVTFATDRIGYYAVNVNANDIACMGATPRWFLASALLPVDSPESLARTVFADLDGFVHLGL